MFAWLKRTILKEYANCRVCGVPIKNGGVCIAWIGCGFCYLCAAKIVREQK